MATGRSRTRGRQGDFLRIDDRTGFTEWASNTVKEWTGAIVHRRRFEPRHPQDFLRARRDDMRISDPRPDTSVANSNFVGPLVTTIAADVPGENSMYAPMGALGQFAIGQAEEGLSESNLAGANAITVDSTSGMSAYDRIGIMLDSGDLYQTRIHYVTGPSTLQLTDVLPSAVSAGNVVIDYTAVTASELA